MVHTRFVTISMNFTSSPCDVVGPRHTHTHTRTHTYIQVHTKRTRGEHASCRSKEEKGGSAVLPAPETALAGTKKRVASSRAGPGQEVHTRDERQERRGKKRGAAGGKSNDGRTGRAREISGELRARSRHVKETTRQEKKHRRLESKRARARKEEREGSSMRYVRKRIYSRSYLSLSLHLPLPPSPFLPAYLRYFVFCDVSLISPE